MKIQTNQEKNHINSYEKKMLKKGFIKEIEKITYFDLHSSINKIE